MSKGKAVMAFAFNVKILAKIPAFIRKTLDSLKADLEEVKAAVEEVKANWPIFSGLGTLCNSEQITEAPACFRRCYGAIKYTKEQRAEWEVKMGEILWKKYTRNFNPADYPTTDMIQEGEAVPEGVPKPIVEAPATER